MIDLILALILAAPAPAPKTPPPAPKVMPRADHGFVGLWEMRWGTGQGRTLFERHGGYSCVWFGTLYVGQWRYDGLRLHVREWTAEAGEQSASTWWVDLDVTQRAGQLGGDGTFELIAPKPDA